MVGKSDAWLHLLGDEPLRNPIRRNRLELGDLRANSDRVRELMMRVCPAVVANAESISSNVLFFAASSFGHAPVKLGPADYAPDPRRLSPFQVEVPMLWLIYFFASDLVPCRDGAP